MILRKIAIAVMLFLVFISAPYVVEAQNETPYDIIAEVNALRASLGLEPYVIDPWIMAYAQDHADYISETQNSTHLHKDGTIPQDAGLQENVAAGTVGYVMSPYFAVNVIWADPVHRGIMVDYASGSVGAGVALASDGMIHYVLNVRKGSGSLSGSPMPGGTDAVEYTPQPFNPFLTSTPAPDGRIIHVVQAGQALWSIAISYGVTVDEIRALNGIAADSTNLYIGQKLVIRKNVIVTPEVTATASPTAAPTATATFIPSPTPLPSWTPTPTPVRGLGNTGGFPMVAVIILAVLAGLAGILFVQLKVTKRPV